MCQVQIIKKLGKNATINATDVKAFFKMLEYGSFSNNDAWGMFGKGYMYRQAGAFHSVKPESVGGLTKAILDKKTSFLIGHNRLTTQGDESKNFNNHPFPSNDWIIVHNGILNNDSELTHTHNLQYKAETDSAVVVNLLQRLTEQGLSPHVAVKQTAESLNGRFSIVAYNKTEDRLFYFKSTGTLFTFRLFVMNDNTEILVGSTDSDNLDKVYVDDYMIFNNPLYQTYYESTAHNGIIYEIMDREIRIIDSFKEQDYRTSTYYGSRYEGGSRTTTSEATNRNFTTTGGIHAHDWEKTEWQERQESLRDIDYGTDAQIVPYDMIDVSEDIDEYSQLLVDEIDSKTGLSWEYDIDWKNSLILLSVADSPIPIGELKSQVKEYIGIEPELQTGKSGNYLMLSFEDVKETYR